MKQLALPLFAFDRAPGAIAAGILFVAPDGDVLLLRRSSTEDNFAGHWALPGGKADDGETPDQAARREALEEMGDHPDGKRELIDQRATPNGMQFHTFKQPVENKFVPKLNDEHSGYAWASRDMLPEPMHPAVKEVLTKTKTAADAALKSDVIAFDRASVRRVDQDGHLFVETTPISKANVCPYLGNEIPDYDKLGLEPGRIYKLLRDPEELAKGAPTFAGKPLVLIHKPVSAEEHPREITVGAVGTVVEFKAPYLMAPLSIWDGEAIELIDSEKQKELSSAYRYRADMTPGTFEGEQYDGVMRDIVGNHVALVKEGRAGSDVIVLDSAIPKLQETFEMSKAALLSRKASVAQGALMMFLRPKLAKDAKIDFGPVLTGLTSKNFKDKKPALVTGVTNLTKGKLAKDANIEGLVELIDALGDVEPAEDEEEDAIVDPNDAGMDADPVEAMRGFLKGKMADDDIEKACALMKPKAAADEDDEEKKKREEEERKKKEAKPAEDEDKDKVTKPAMDAAVRQAEDAATKRAEANTMKRLNDIRIAERAVAPLLGTVTTALDSADAIYLAALKANGIKTDGVPPAAFPAMVEMLVSTKTATRAAPVHVAADSNTLAEFKKSIGDDRSMRVLG
jgi:8-oxo-dGTP pyrophosphatase MutT (NUDIX family)